MITIFLLAFVVSACSALLVIRYSHVHIRFTADHNGGGPQKFHALPTPRIGGIPILVGLVVCLPLIVFLGFDIKGVGFLILSSMPAFAGGIIEDLTKKVGPLQRLLLTFVAAAVGFYLLDGRLIRVDIALIDNLLVFAPVSFILTIIAVGGISHAVNIIDGYNGLAGMICLLIFGAIGYVSFIIGDMYLTSICMMFAGALVGFLIWNYPRGRIFAGDGGAYLLGFVIAEISVLLVKRHPEVSPWFPLLLVIYPVWETFFSIYRKKVLQGRSPGLPDGLHFHMLIYKRLVRWMIGSKQVKHIIFRNSMTSPYLWTFSMMSIIPAVLFWRYTVILSSFVLMFIVIYVWLYWRIVRFKAPRWLILSKKA